ncbi:ATP-binding protein [Alteromonadaceae bacterium M269]|nr:ATP-binding protein [Alteromonadaceae bacterium M269]
MNFEEFRGELVKKYVITGRKLQPEFKEFRKHLLEYLIKEFSSEGRIDGEIHQWPKIFNELSSHSEAYYGKINSSELRKSLRQGQGEKEHVFVLYYGLHTFKRTRINSETKETEHPYKNIAYKLDIEAFGEQQEIDFIDGESETEETDIYDKVKTNNVRKRKPQLDHQVKSPTLANLIEQPHYIRSTSDNLALGPFNPYQTRISSLTEGAFPRDTIQNKVSAHIAEYISGYISICGESGTGKSSLLASMYLNYAKLTNYLCVYHVVSSDHGAGATLNFVSHLYVFLDQHSFLTGTKRFIKDVSDLNLSNCSMAVSSIFSDVNEYLLANKNQKLLIFIDGLEDISGEDFSSTDLTVNELLLPSYLSINTYVAVSCRVASNQKFLSPIINFNLDSKSKIHENDLRAYLKNKFETQEVRNWASNNHLSEEEFVDLLILRSEHKFVYLNNILATIDSYNKNNLPYGIDEFYNIELIRLTNSISRKKRSVFSQLIAALLWFRKGVSVERLSIFISMSEPAIIEFTKPLMKLDFIVFDNNNGVVFIRIKHLSFFSFLEKKWENENTNIHHQSYTALFQKVRAEFRWDKYVLGYINPTESEDYLCESMLLLVKSALLGRQFEEVIEITRNAQLQKLVMQRCPNYFFQFDNECLHVFNRCFKHLLDNYSEEEALNYHLDYLNSECLEHECIDSKFRSLVLNQYYNSNDSLEKFYNIFTKKYDNSYFFKNILIMLSMAITKSESLDGESKLMLRSMFSYYEKEKLPENCLTTKKLIKSKALDEFIEFFKSRLPLTVSSLKHWQECNPDLQFKPSGQYLGRVRINEETYHIGLGDINRPYTYVNKITVLGESIPVSSKLSVGYDMNVGVTINNFDLFFKKDDDNSLIGLNEVFKKYTGIETILGTLNSLLDVKINGKNSKKYDLYIEIINTVQSQ